MCVCVWESREAAAIYDWSKSSLLAPEPSLPPFPHSGQSSASDNDRFMHDAYTNHTISTFSPVSSIQASTMQL